MADIKVTLTLEGNKEISSQLKAIESQVQSTIKSTKQTSGAFDSLKNSVKGVGSTLASIGGSIFSLAGAATAFVGAFAVKEVVQAASEYETAIARLNQSLKLSGDFSKQASQDFQDFAGSLQKTAGVADDQTLGLLTTAKAFGATNEQAKLLTKAAIDLSAATGKDLDTSITVLSKSLSGNIKEIQRYAPEIKTLTKAQLASADAAQLIADRFSGSAAAALRTFGGATKGLGLSFEDLLKEVGFLITQNPVVIAGINLFSQGIQQLSEFVKENKDLIIQLTTDGLKNFISAMLSVSSAVASALAVILNLAGGILQLVSAIEKTLFIDDILSGLSKGFLFFGDVVIQTFQDILGSARKAFGAFGDNAFTKGIDSAISGLDSLRTRGEQAFTAIEKNGIGVSKFTNTVGAGLQGAASGLNKFADSTSLIDAKIGAAIEKQKAGFQGLEAQGRKTFPALEQLQSSLAEGALTEIQKVNNARQESFAIVAQGVKQGAITEQEAANLRVEINKQANKKIADENKGIQADTIRFTNELSDAIAKIGALEAKNPFEGATKELEKLRESFQKLSPKLDPKSKAKLKKDLEEATNISLFAKGAGIATAITKGAEGASQLLTQGASKLVDTIVPGMGEAVAPIFEAFAKGPEAVKQMVQQFISSIPIILQNVILSIPVFINEVVKQIPVLINAIIASIPTIIRGLVDQLPVLIQTLVALTPNIIQGLVDNLPALINALIASGPDIMFALASNAPLIVTSLVKSLITQLPGIFIKLGGNVIEGIFQSITKLPNILKSIFKFDGGGKGVVENFLGFDFPFIKFAKGGLVPGTARKKGDSLSNDTVPALLSPGEIVLPRSVVGLGASGIAQFIDKLGIGNLRKNAVSQKDAGPLVDMMKSLGFAPAQFGLFDKVGSFIHDVVQGIGGAIETGTGTVSDIIAGVQNGSISDVEKAIKQGAVNILAVGASGLPEPFRSIYQSLLALGAKINIIDLIRNPKEAIKGALKDVLSVFTGPFKKLMDTKGLLNPVGFATGGLVPQGFGNDTFPARLSSGEFVLNNTLTPRLERFLDSNERGDGGQSRDLLARILTVLEQPMNVNSEIKFNDDVLADRILTLTRGNRRLS